MIFHSQVTDPNAFYLQVNCLTQPLSVPHVKERKPPFVKNYQTRSSTKVLEEIVSLETHQAEKKEMRYHHLLEVQVSTSRPIRCLIKPSMSTHHGGRTVTGGGKGPTGLLPGLQNSGVQEEVCV